VKGEEQISQSPEILLGANKGVKFRCLFQSMDRKKVLASFKSQQAALPFLKLPCLP